MLVQLMDVLPISIMPAVHTRMNRALLRKLYDMFLPPILDFVERQMDKGTIGVGRM